MTDGVSRFTSDRRTPRKAAWKDDVDWAAGTAENVDVTGSDLVGRSTQLNGLPDTIVEDFANGDLSAWDNYGTGGASITNFALHGDNALRVVRSSSNGNYLRNWSPPMSGRIELWFALAYEGIHDFTTFGDFADTNSNAVESGFRLVHDSDRIGIETDVGRTTLVSNPTDRSYYPFRVNLDLDALVVESVAVNGSVTAVNEPFQSNSPLSELIGVRTGDSGGSYTVFLDGIRYGVL